MIEAARFLGLSLRRSAFLIGWTIQLMLVVLAVLWAMGLFHARFTMDEMRQFGVLVWSFGRGPIGL
jgi:hypothetical protein